MLKTYIPKLGLLAIILSIAGMSAGIEAPPVPGQESEAVDCTIPHPQCINGSGPNGSKEPDMRRDISSYSEDQVFVLSDSSWEKVLVSLPATNWRGNDSMGKNPLLVYSKEESGIDVDSTIRYIQNYQPNEVTILGESSRTFKDLLVADPDLGAGVESDKIQEVSDNINQRFWSNITEAVYAPNNYKKAMKAAVYASDQNLPLVVRGFNSEKYREKNVTFRCVDIESNMCGSKLSAQEALEVFNRNSNTEKKVYTNSDDLEESTQLNLRTSRTSSDIEKGFYRDSLVSPYLAVWRNQELLINDEESKEKVNSYLQQRLESGETLSIVGSPQAIPFREKKSNLGGVNNYKALDPTLYADLDSNDRPDVDVGRIAAPTITDTSALVTRSVFNERVAEHDRKSFIASDFDHMIQNAESYKSKFDSSGHNTSIVTNPETKTFDSRYWDNNGLTYYLDHGLSTWAGVSESNIPEMRGTIMLTNACSTCAGTSAYEGSPVYCWQAIRQGANAHLGAVSIAWTGNKIYSEFANGVYHDDENIGEAFRGGYQKQMSGESGDPLYWMTSLLGDPNLNPKHMSIQSEISGGY